MHSMPSLKEMKTKFKSTQWLSMNNLVMWTCLVGIATSATDSPPLPVEKPSPRYAVAYEDLNAHCFTPSSYGPSNADGDFEKYCLPGYRMGTRAKPCPNGRKCCPCEEWTYQPKSNLCEDCVRRKYCPDYGKKFESYGNITTNSKCGEDIQLKSIPTEGVSTLATVNDDKEVPVTFQTTMPHGQECSICNILMWAAIIGILLLVSLMMVLMKPWCNLMSKNKGWCTYGASKRQSFRAVSTSHEESSPQPGPTLISSEVECCLEESSV